MTNKKEKHEALRGLSKQYYNLFNNSKDAIMLLDDSGFFDCNEATVKMFNCDSIEHFCSLHPSDLSPQHQSDGQTSLTKSTAKIEKAFKEGHAHFNWIHKRYNGEIFEAEVTLSRIETDDKSFLTAFVKDISERVYLQNELKDRSSQIQIMLESIPGFVSWLSPEFEYIAVNKHLADHFKLDPSEFVGRKIGFNESKTSIEIIELCKRLNETSENILQKEIDTHTFLNGIRSVLLTCRKFDNDKGYIVIGIDHTDLKEAQTNLAREKQKIEDQAKLVALGEMAGGIGHEIVNPLSIVDGYLKMIGKKGGEAVAKDVNRAQHSIDRIGKIIKGLGRLSRNGDGDPIELLYLKDVFEDTLTFCSSKLKKYGVELIFDDVDEDQQVLGRHVQLCQVLLNLINNARDAVCELESRWIRIEFESREKFFIIRIVDSGDGISKEHRDKIFESFYTTKEVGKGTGLGLSLSKKLMIELGGDLVLDQEADNTTFEVSIQLPS